MLLTRRVGINAYCPGSPVFTGFPGFFYTRWVQIEYTFLDSRFPVVPGACDLFIQLWGILR